MPRRTGRGGRGHGSGNRGGGSAAGGGGGGGGGGEEREIKISKGMSYVLRHGAEKEGVRLDENGYANVAELLSWPRLSSLNVTFPELLSIVRTNAKQRFALIPLPTSTPPSSATNPSSSSPPFTDPQNPSHHLIRATQGHSIPIPSANLLSPIRATDSDRHGDGDVPREVVHGTYRAAWEGIVRDGGLRPMGRTHVHFALAPTDGVGVLPSSPSRRLGEGDSGSGSGVGDNDEMPSSGPGPGPAAGSLLIPPASSSDDPSPSASPSPAVVISGMRASATVLVWVQVKRSLEAGALQWWRAANGVVLTEGDGRGLVGLEWVCRVQVRGEGGMWVDLEGW